MLVIHIKDKEMIRSCCFTNEIDEEDRTMKKRIRR